MVVAEVSSEHTQMEEANAKASRPDIPPIFGVPKADECLLSWTHVVQRLTEAKFYWLSTVYISGQPYATPVDGLWLGGLLYFGGSPKTRWSRNLSQNQALCVHLESGFDVVILRGEAVELKGLERKLAEILAKKSQEKYGYASEPETYENSDGVYAFRPRVVLAWKQFPQDVTKWEIT
jgi:nitroimidazol reductase NimA-like FMN-containing flavoprotein (pyridoxamine 5'-phosphate oxidase superfamily)